MPNELVAATDGAGHTLSIDIVMARSLGVRNAIDTRRASLAFGVIEGITGLRNEGRGRASRTVVANAV